MKTDGQPTLADVARAAGVGVATVSRVVNGGINVSPDTLKKVQLAVRRLGYLPNHAARILKGGRTKTIGLLVPSIADSFFSSIAEAAETVVRSHDSLLIFADTKNDRELEMSNLQVLMRHRPDGLLIVPSGSGNRRLRQFVRQSAVPIVTIDRPFPGCSSVVTDGFEAALSATRHLIEHGRKRILCFAAGPELYTISERIRGYREAMREVGLEPLIEDRLSSDAKDAEQRLREWLRAKTRPDAVFALKNSVTAASYQALQRLKVSVPSDIALLGFDDFELASMLRPAISVVQQPMEAVGRRAAELLFDQLAQSERAPGRRPAARTATRVVLENRLVLRSSCGCRNRSE